MTHGFAISPDVHVRDITDWFVLNTRLQRLTGEPFRATVYDDFGDLHRAYADGRVDLVYANAADTALLVRDHGFVPVAAPQEVADEAVVVVAEDGPLKTLDDLGAHLTVAATDAPDVERICRILLEPADLTAADLDLVMQRNYVLVAKAVMSGTAEVGFFLRAAYDQLSQVIRARLRPLISSKIYVVSHCLLAAPTIADQVDTVLAGLQALAADPANAALLAALAAPAGWKPMTREDTEFMIDLMDALAQQ
ncbi:MAG: PhnD/SsuA/transferrin family substrate-binding protein [Kineosporiaceae bacterium]